MSLIDDHFRTDGKRIEPCCKRMNERLFGNSDDFEIFIDLKGKIKTWYDKDSGNGYGEMYLKKCPYCGAKLEYVDKLKTHDPDPSILDYCNHEDRYFDSDNECVRCSFCDEVIDWLWEKEDGGQ